MLVSFVFLFCSFALILSLILSSTTAEKAKWLVRYQKTDQKFELNKDALSKLSHLPKPVKVISAIGEARVGKSTTLNFVRHVLNCDGKREAEIEEVFETGDSLKPVTYGIWMSVCEKESIVLLDVEGTNLGNDAVTSHMSVFTSLMSSGIVVFSSETVKNDILNFLYEVTRLSEHIFKNIDNNNSFGHLHIVIRDPVSPSPGKTFEDEVRDMMIRPSGANIVTDKKSKYFYRDNIKVSKIPRIGNRQRLKDIQIKNDAEFWNTIQSLSKSFKNFPAKTTLRSNLVDGEALVQIAKTLIKMMNKNSWLDFGDNYLMVEKYLCDKSFQVTVEPTLALKTAHEIEQRKESVLKAFKDGCGLTEEVNKIEEQLRTLISDIREKEEKARQLQAAEEAKRRAEMEREAAERSRKEMKEIVEKIIKVMEKDKSEKEEKTRQLQAAEEAKRKSEMEREAAERSVNEIKETVNKMKEEMEKDKREKEEKTKQLQAAGEAKRKSEMEQEAAERSINEIKETVNKMKEEMEKDKREKEEKTRQLQAAEEAKRKSEMEREAAERSVNEIKETVNKMKEEMEKDKREKEEKTMQLQASEEAKRKSEMEREAAERSVNEIKETVKQIKEEMENDKREKEEKTRQLQAAEEAIRKSEMERKAAEKSVNKMKETVKKLEEETENLKQNIKNLMESNGKASIQPLEEIKTEPFFEGEVIDEVLNGNVTATIRRIISLVNNGEYLNGYSVTFLAGFATCAYFVYHLLPLMFAWMCKLGKFIKG